MRELVVPTLLALIACSPAPGGAPKDGADCPGRKACGNRCVQVDDPAAGCRADTCEACPAGPAHTASYCDGLSACAVRCVDGYHAPTGDPAEGCEPVAAGDAENCGAPGHACGVGEACIDKLCPVVDVQTAAGEALRGLAVWGPTTYAWTTDPQEGGGSAARGTLHRVVDGVRGADVTGLGKASWVRRMAIATAEPEASWVAVAGTRGEVDEAFVLDLRGEAAPRWFGGIGGSTMVGMSLWPGWIFMAFTSPGASGPNELEWTADHPGVYSDSGGRWRSPLTAVGEGAGSLWIGSAEGVARFTSLGDPAIGMGFDEAIGGGLSFEGMATKPRPDRIAARAGPTPEDPVEVYFVDLQDGTIRTARAPGAGTQPWQLGHAKGPRTQMDLAADDRGVVWSDHDSGEVWEYVPGNGAEPFLLARGKPWAIALTADRVYWTDTEAQAIRSVAR